ncbi:hypothetical protein [Accumulibacter sp.]|uniref:hypothetical protein n=1 Tax=Accumulibacter sp. TaxID=2053492 RepID=UPI0026144330|nr:hypothetical protein [Accumulibacter sp.]
MTRFFYAPGAGDAPVIALPRGTRADQTGLALFFFLRLGGPTRWRGSARIAGTNRDGYLGSPFRLDDGTRRRDGRTWVGRNTTRKPLLSLRLSG